MTPAAARRRAPVRRRQDGVRFIVLTGLSGAGKSQVVHALEDLGYFCVDNLPIAMTLTLAELAGRAESELERVAMVVDVRGGTMLSRFPAMMKALRAMRRLETSLIFLEASDEALVRRFSETRRPHPLAHDRPVIEGIREERRRLAPIRRLADRILDTTDLTVHQLRRVFMTLPPARRGRARMVVTFESFGFKHGVPAEADLVFDVRCLPNPHFVPDLRAKTGRHRDVVAFMASHPVTRAFVKHIADFLRFTIPHYVAEGKSYLTVAVGCTGGQHRSVMIAEALKRAVAGAEDVTLRVRHRDIGAGRV